MKMTKKVLSILLSFMLVLGAVSVGGMSASADGYIYEISSYEELKAFASRVNSGDVSACAKLMNDIVATCYNVWTPIGMDNNHIYIGTFDGNGCVIIGLSNSEVTDMPQYAGLFGYVGSKTEGGVTTKGTVKNVGLVGGSISGQNYAGGVVGYNNGGSVTNCYNTGDVTATGMFTYGGGVVGYNEQGTVKNCYNTGSVSDSGNSDVGGVVGRNASGSVTNCYNTGSVSGNSGVGGVAGYSDRGSVTNCYYDKSVCGEIGAVRGTDSETAKGLTTAQMTGESALDNMTFAYEAGVENPWLAKENGQADGRNIFYFYYPHLSGINLDSDRPARLEITVNTTEFTYTGAPERPLKEDIIIVSGSMEVPDEFKDKAVTYSRWNEELSEWEEILDSSVENPGRYRVTVTWPGETEVLFERCFTVLETGDISVTISAVNGNTSVTGADAGDYEAKIQFTKYGNIEITVPYKINPADAEISVTAEDANCSETVKATVTASTGIGNNFTVTLEKQKNADEWEEVDALPSGITNGTQFEISGLSAGDYRLTASYDGGNYKACSASDEFSVNIIDPGMTLTYSPEEPVYLELATVTANLPSDAEGTVTFTFGGTTYTADVENGKATFELLGDEELYHEDYRYPGAGHHDIKAEYSGDAKYSPVTLNEVIEIGKGDPRLEVTVLPENPVYGDSVIITAKIHDLAVGKVAFTVTDENNQPIASQEIGIVDAAAQLDLDVLDAGNYTVKADYPGDDNFFSDSQEMQFSVGKAAPEINVTAEDITYGETEEIIVTSNAEGMVTVSIEEIDKEVEVSLDNGEATLRNSGYNGKATVSVPDLKPDEYHYTVHFSGNENYTEKDITGSFKVNPVDCALTINYVYASGGEAYETYTDNVAIFTQYSVTSPEIANYTPDTATVEGTMGDDDIGGKTVTVTYTPVEFTATFVDENGETVEEVKFTVEDESITEPAVPEKQGYEGKWSAYTLAASDITIPAEYTAIEFTATFVDENGNTVDEVKFTVETEKLDEPEVPGKTNYTGAWEEYTLGANDITIKPVYTLAGETVVNTDSESEITTDYKESKRYAFEPKFVPEGATAHVFYNGEDRGEGTSIEVKEPTEDYTVECKVLDAEGNEIATSGEIKVKVKNSFFDRLKWFFNNFWANILKTFIEAIIKAC